jgi:hypothetical protein
MNFITALGTFCGIMAKDEEFFKTSRKSKL